MNIKTYLHFPGNAREALAFYTDVFGGQLGMTLDFADAPEGMMPPQDADRLMHANLTIGSSQLMMSDIASDYEGAHIVGTNMSISIEPKDRAEADRVMAALAEGGEVNMPMQDAFWGGQFGMVKDKYNIQWMLSVDV